ncbi:MAG: tetratricopeptide repeat protein, partial [Alphaproteobacteria bacterium]
MFGYMLDHGKGGEADKVRARTVYETACTDDVAQACNNLALMVRDGVGGHPVDLPRARKLAEKTCELGERYGCYLLGLMLHRGEGGPADVKRARTLLDRACRLGIGAACGPQATGGDARADTVELVFRIQWSEEQATDFKSRDKEAAARCRERGYS